VLAAVGAGFGAEILEEVDGSSMWEEEVSQ
jgi:hypothetical protein